MLGDAIQRLLGLHLVERLRTDLRVYALRHDANGAEHQASDELERLQTDYHDLLREIDLAQADLACTQERLAALVTEHDRLDLRLTERGGDWGVSRESWRTKAAELAETLRESERQLREDLAGVYPLALARNALVPALDAASASLHAQTQARANDLGEGSRAPG